MLYAFSLSLLVSVLSEVTVSLGLVVGVGGCALAQHHIGESTSSLFGVVSALSRGGLTECVVLGSLLLMVSQIVQFIFVLIAIIIFFSEEWQ